MPVPPEAAPRRRPRLVYLVTEDWYFMMHRLTTARAARDAGYEVHVITRVGAQRAAMEAEGFRVHGIAWQRASLNPASFVASARSVQRLYREIRPDIVHHVAFQAVIVGALAATGLGIPQVNSIVGLGFVFSSPALRARLVRPVLERLLVRLLSRPHTLLIVENQDDAREMAARGIPSGQIRVIGGAAKPFDSDAPLPEPDGPVTAAFVGRMLEDKGVRTLIEAHRLLADRGVTLRLLLAGLPDPANPAAIPATEIEGWTKDGTVRWLGHVEDIRSVWAAAHIAVLPSRREGLPQSLIEAAAYGRPMVATDVPGCREIALHEQNALVVPADDAPRLAEALGRLTVDATLRQRLGAQAHGLVNERFSSASVSTRVLTAYAALLTGR